MEPKQHMPSVIAKLMALEPPKPVQRRQSVFSESYKQRVTSLGSSRKQPFNKRPSFRLSADEQEEIRNIFQETVENGINYSLSFDEGKMHLTPSEAEMAFLTKTCRLRVFSRSGSSKKKPLLLENEKKISACEVTLARLVLPSSPVFSCWKDKCKSSFSRSVGSYVQREARNQILLESKPRISGLKSREHGLSNLICPDDGDVNFEDEAIIRYFSTPKSPTKARPNHKGSHNKRYLGPVQHKSWIHKKVGIGKSGSSCMKSQSMPGLVSNNGEGNNFKEDKLSGKQKKNAMNNMYLSEQSSDDDSSQISYNLTQQDIFAGNFEEGSVSSFFGTDSDSLMNIEDYKESYQPSPVSVLEPFLKEDISSGLQRQIDFLNLDFLESYSDESGMIVSSDEETTEERFDDNSEETENKMEPFKVEESQDFSYIIDVLHEAGYWNSDTGFNKWHSPELAINPSLFEKLEKKYGKQRCWKTSERRLLFDRINLALTDILQPPLGTPTWAKPLSKRLSFKQNLEEELWLLLEKKVTNYPSNPKVLAKDDKWLDLRDDIEAIGREIESSLIDELITAAISME